MIPDFKISKYISFYELTNTRNYGLQNENREFAVPYIFTLRDLSEQILDPIRDKIGPFIVSSGFRCVPVNDWVGGAKTSKHLYGMAADIFKPEWDLKACYDAGKTIFDHFKQLGINAKIIIEASKGSYWLHVNMNKELVLWEGIAGVYKKLA